MAGGALGSMIAPGIGTALGSQLGSMASNLFEMELEGMDHEQAEFETARRYVQLAASAAQNAAHRPPGRTATSGRAAGHHVRRRALRARAAPVSAGAADGAAGTVRGTIRAPTATGSRAAAGSAAAAGSSSTASDRAGL